MSARLEKYKLVRAKLPGKVVRYTAPDTNLEFKIKDLPGRDNNNNQGFLFIQQALQVRWNSPCRLNLLTSPGP